MISVIQNYVLPSFWISSILSLKKKVISWELAMFRLQEIINAFKTDINTIQCTNYTDEFKEKKKKIWLKIRFGQQIPEIYFWFNRNKFSSCFKPIACKICTYDLILRDNNS